MPTEIKKATIAVGNIITGVFNFMTISIPYNWRIASISMNSDVFSTMNQGNIKWVTEGEVEHFLQTREAKAAFRIKVKKGIKQKEKFKSLKKLEKDKEVLVSTHNAQVFKYIERFLWQKRTVLGVLFQCSDTNRTILLEFINGDPWVEEILECLKESQCHLSKNFEKALSALDLEDDRFNNYT